MTKISNVAVVLPGPSRRSLNRPHRHVHLPYRNDDSAEAITGENFLWNKN